MYGILLALLFACVALIYFYLHSIYAYWQRRGVPHERPLLLLGNLKGLGRQVHFRDVNRRIYEQFKDTSPLAGVYYFTGKLVMLLDLDLIKQVMIKDFVNFHDRAIFSNVADEPLTSHLFALEGEEWRAMRTKLTPVFSSGKMKFMFPTVVEVGHNLNAVCGELLASSINGELELKELSARYTTDVIGTCAFGIECNSLHNPDAEFRRRGRELFAKPRHSQMVRTFMVLHPQMARRLHMKFFPDDISDFFMGMVQRTVEYRLEHNIKRNDFIDLLIELMDKDELLGEKHHKEEKGSSTGFSLEQMAAQAFVFFVAGFDTSSTTMSFCLYELALNEDIQNRVREEITNVLKAHNNELTYEAMNEMEYLDKVMAETLRKYPVVPHIVRKTVHEYHVPNTKFVIEKGLRVLIPVHAIHHDPELYPEPEIFDPARFEPEAVSTRHHCAYLPFGEGPRSCIGIRFGKMQTKIGLISLLKDFKFSKCERTEVPVVLSKKSFMLTAEHGLHFKVERV